jgi:hypothetical protein
MLVSLLLLLVVVLLPGLLIVCLINVAMCGAPRNKVKQRAEDWLGAADLWFWEGGMHGAGNKYPGRTWKWLELVVQVQAVGAAITSDQ